MLLFIFCLVKIKICKLVLDIYFNWFIINISFEIFVWVIFLIFFLNKGVVLLFSLLIRVNLVVLLIIFDLMLKVMVFYKNLNNGELKGKGNLR